jgi:uncharacterized protein (TIRG00374 family)
VKRFWPITIGAAIFALFVIIGGWENLARLRGVRPLPAAGAVLATIGITGSIAFRWGTVADTLVGRRVTGWFRYYYYFMMGRFLGFFLPKDVTDIASRTVMLNRFHGVPMSQSATSVVIDRLGDVLAMTVLLPACLPYWLGWVSGLQGIGIMLGLALFFGLLLYIFHLRIAWIIERSMTFLAVIVRYIPGMKRHLYTSGRFPSFERGTLLTFYTTSVLKVVLTAFRFALFALALGIPIPFTLLVLATPLGQLSYMFSFTPGGLGILEAGWFGILVFSGISTDHASTFVVGQRVLTVAIITLLTAITHFGFGFHKQEDEPPGDKTAG